MAGPALCWGAFIIAVAVFLPFSTAAGFIDTPGNVVVHIGETALVQCSVDLRNVQGSMTMYWYKVSRTGGMYITIGQSVRKNLVDAERYSLDTSNVRGVFKYNLRITNAEVTDSGQYQCMAVDSAGTSRSEPGSLSVVQEANSEPLRCSIYPEAPTLGQAVTFSCIAPRGIAPDTLTWWMDGRVQIQPEAHLANEHGISFVKTLAETDNFAEFTCLVGSSFSTMNGMNCSVTPLAVPIRAEVTPSVQNAVIAGDATFQCRGTAIPPVQRYRWLCGSGDSTIKISESKGRFFVVNNGDSSTLTITRLTAEDNNMMVRCVALNAITKTFGVAELHVSTTQMAITSQQTKSPSAQTDEVSSLSTTIARNQEITSGTTPSFKTDQDSTKAEVLDTTQIHASTEDGTGSVINVHECVKNCGEKISPQQSPSENSSGSGNGAIAAVLSLLAIFALVIVAIVYLVYKKKGGPKAGRVLKRKLQKNKAIERLRSLRMSTVSTSNQDLVTRDSVRLKTIEVIVNPPPPEWQFRVHDVTIEQVTQDENATDDNPSPVMMSDDGRKDAGEVDALYAKADPMKKKKKKHHGRPQVDGVDAHLPVESPPSAVAGHYLSVETDDADWDGLSDASTWDMSSVDSGCEETDAIHENGDDTYAELHLATGGEVGKTCPSQTEAVEYANITISDEATCP